MNTRPLALAVAVAVSFAAGILIGCTSGVHAGQPHMQAALDSLRNAEHELSVAEEDKGGHRATALRLTREAIGETNAGIEFAARHH